MNLDLGRLVEPLVALGFVFSFLYLYGSPHDRVWALVRLLIVAFVIAAILWWRRRQRIL